MRTVTVALMAAALFGPAQTTARNGPAGVWTFDAPAPAVARSTGDVITGRYRLVQGVSGRALQFDGKTTAVRRLAPRAPKLTGGFTVEAWVSLAAYPKSWTGILTQVGPGERGFQFGIDDSGHPGLQLAVESRWATCASTKRIPLRRWTHLAAKYYPEHGITVYFNGKPAGSLTITGSPIFAPESDILIGRSDEQEPPAKEDRAAAGKPVANTLNGALDEIALWNRPLHADEVAARFRRIRRIPPTPTAR